jgi:hypothetical protein
MLKEGRSVFDMFFMKADALQTSLFFIPGTIFAEINNVLINRLTAKAVERISKTKSEIDFMLTYKNMRIGVQIVAAAEHVVDDHEEGTFPYGIASGLCSEHGVESDVESDGGADLTVFAACAKLVAPNLI